MSKWDEIVKDAVPVSDETIAADMAQKAREEARIAATKAALRARAAAEKAAEPKSTVCPRCHTYCFGDCNE